MMDCRAFLSAINRQDRMLASPLPASLGAHLRTCLSYRALMSTLTAEGPALSPVRSSVMDAIVTRLTIDLRPVRPIAKSRILAARFALVFTIVAGPACFSFDRQVCL